jgi:quinolinate synthase
MISVEENEVGKSADIKYIELSNTWVNEIIATITNITEQIKSEYPEIELNLTNGQVSTTTQVIQLQEIRSKVSLLRNNFLNVQSKIDSTALKLKLTSEDYFYSDLFEEIETQKELENEKLQAEIQSIKINNIKILNEIQTNEELLKLVDEELNKTVAEVVGIDEKKGD